MVDVLDPVAGDEDVGERGGLLWHEFMRARSEMSHSLCKLEHGRVNHLQPTSVQHFPVWTQGKAPMQRRGENCEPEREDVEKEEKVKDRSVSLLACDSYKI